MADTIKSEVKKKNEDKTHNTAKICLHTIFMKIFTPIWTITHYFDDGLRIVFWTLEPQNIFSQKYST